MTSIWADAKLETVLKAIQRTQERIEWLKTQEGSGAEIRQEQAVLTHLKYVYKNQME